jgi:hypothetical protein
LIRQKVRSHDETPTFFTLYHNNEEDDSIEEFQPILPEAQATNTDDI